MEEKNLQKSDNGPKIKKTTIYHFPNSGEKEEKQSESLKTKKSLFARVKEFVSSLFKDGGEFDIMSSEEDIEEANDLTRIEKKKIEGSVFGFTLTETILNIKKDVFDNLSFVSNFVPFILEDGTIVNIYFSSGSERSFPTEEDIQKNIGFIFKQETRFFFSGSLEESQAKFLSVCYSKKMRSDQSFIKNCLQKEWDHIEKMRSREKDGIIQKKHSFDQVNFLRKDFHCFESLEYIYSLEKNLHHYFDSDHNTKNISKAFNDFFECYRNIEANLRLYKDLYGVERSKHSFTRVEKIFYGFDILVAKIENLISLNSRRIQFIGYKKKQIEDEKVFNDFISLIKEEQKVLIKISGIFKDWKKARGDWACSANISSHTEISYCPRRFMEVIIDNKGNSSERDFCCCNEEGITLGKCYLDQGEKPIYCIR
uniref:Uncharacterized protein n=1 Tax=candidate division CPR3 bacterium TaxID=2268181 RepID=A0A7C4R5E7_UNCC3